MGRQMAHEIKGRRVTLAGVAALASLAFVTWAFIPNAYSTSDVESCDTTLGPAALGFNFSGIFEGSIVEKGQSGTAAQVKFVRTGHSVRGSYLIGEICGSIGGEVNRDRLEFTWRRADNSGHGIASQIADRVSGTFGLGEDVEGGGTFVLVQRRVENPPAALGQGISVGDTADAAALNQQVTQLYNRGRYSEAIPLAQRALAIGEKALGPDHPDVAASLNNLAEFYRIQGRYAEAEPLFKRALTIKEKAFGPDHPDVALSLNSLAELYRAQGRFAEAEPLYQRSLTIFEKSLGPDHPHVAVLLNNLATLYDLQGRFPDAEQRYLRSMAISEKTLGPDHPNAAFSLNNLAGLYRAEGRYADAERNYRRSLAIREKALGADHPDVAASLNNLADLFFAQGRYAEAEPLLKRSSAINEKVLGPGHPSFANSLNNLGFLYQAQGRYAEAEQYYGRSLAIREKALGADHPDVTAPLSNLADLFFAQGRYAESEPLLKRSLAVNEKAFGPVHPTVAKALSNLGVLYNAQGRFAEAGPLLERSLAIQQTALGPDHPDVATSLNNLAELYRAQGRFAEAEPLYQRSLAIVEKSLGTDHPFLAVLLNNLAVLYGSEARYSEAESYYKRSLAIGERALGVNHPEVASKLNNLAMFYINQARYSEAVPIVQRTIAQNEANKFVAIVALYGSRSQNLISPTQAVNASFAVLQRSAASAAGEAVSKLAVRFAGGNNELAQLVRKDQDLTAESDRLDKSIIAAVSKLSAERNASAENQIRKRIDEIKLERGKLQDVLNQRFPDYVALSKPQPLTIEQTQALLADDEALVTIDLDKKSYVWVVTKDQAEWKELTVNAEDVSKLVETLRAGLDPDSPKPFERRVAYQVYRRVLGPIEDIISQKKRLSFVLSGGLTSLPLQVLIASDPEGEDLEKTDWLVRKYAITILPSVASLKILRDRKSVVASVKPMIGFGDPILDRTAQTGPGQKVSSLNRSLTSFYRGMTADTTALAKALLPLPETADELRAIANELGAEPEDIKLGEAATVTDVKHERLDNYRVVYFATHALVAGQVEEFAKVKAEPALVLSIPDKPSEDDDGLLRASDVAMLKMNADFVVLSACNTAAGDKPGAEALSGLARAFFYAGARSLIVSNWEVDSDSTVALMTGLFDALKSNPHLTHAEALRLSMLKMINNPSKPEWSQPKFWAPFVVVGEPQKN
jgi:CHAT domain-containing protein/Tfp pilus assembly protein PilF